MNLDIFFKPKNIAVFGASRSLEKPGRVILRNIMRGGFKGEIYPLNPRAEEIEGLKVFSPKDLPDVDLAIFAIRADLVPKALEEVAEKVKGALIIAGGFGEVGRRDLDEELMKIREEYGIRIWGPNCLGILNTYENLNATFIPLERMSMPKKGGISILSQSGATVASIVDWANKKGFGISKVASYGNQLDVTDYEIIDYFEKDTETKVIGFYVEGLKDGRKILDIELKKPVIYLKAGRGERGRKAAKSHTGAMAGDYKIYKGVLRQIGFGEARDLEEFINSLGILERWGKIGKKIAIITCGGGFGVMCVDCIEEEGLELADLKKSLEKLKEAFPERVVLSNPLDLTGDATPEMFETAIREVKEEADVIVIILLFQLPRLNEKIADVLEKNLDKPLIVVSPPGEVSDKFNKLIKAPLFETPDRAIKALKVAHYSSFRRNQ